MNTVHEILKVRHAFSTRMNFIRLPQRTHKNPLRIQMSNVVNTIIQIRGISTIYDALNSEI